jgi:uncharacterized protein
MATWRCIKNCGACCYLEPSERPGLEDYLSPEDLEHYLSLVGDDGWCVNFDRVTRECRIYDERPRFCRVQADTFGEMFGIGPREVSDFAIDCCREHIGDLYGEDSLEMLRFDRAVNEE